jgi:hypothetical protein
LGRDSQRSSGAEVAGGGHRWAAPLGKREREREREREVREERREEEEERVGAEPI